MLLKDITPLLENARAQALARKKQVLVSTSQRIDPLDPLAALDNITRVSAADERLAAHVAAGCIYWNSQKDGLVLAGVGAAVTLEPSGPHRFQEADAAWTSLLDGALIENAAVESPAPGPLLMGGFAFDPDGPRTGQWEGFPSAHLIVPHALITSDGRHHWLTRTALVGSDGSVDLEAVTLLGDAMLEGPPAREPETPASADDRAVEYREPLLESEWRDIVSLAVNEIRSGNIEKVVLARELRAAASHAIDVFSLLRHLRSEHRNSFVFGYWRGARAFVGASPERLVRLDGQEVRTSSLAGTIKRGSTQAEDSANSRELLQSEKDRAEHAAVRSAMVQALGEVCDDVVAPEEPSLLTLPHLHHLHTPFRARLRAGASILSLAGRLHPTPAVGGTPRDAALRFIADHEHLDRGWYASPIGWIGRQNGEFAVALRSALIVDCGATLFAGCGIVAGSDPELEYAESSLKMQPMQSALEAALASERSDAMELAAGAEHLSS